MFDMMGNQISENLRSISNQLLSNSNKEGGGRGSAKKKSSYGTTKSESAQKQAKAQSKSQLGRRKSKSSVASLRATASSTSRLFAPSLNPVTGLADSGLSTRPSSCQPSRQYQCAVYLIHCARHGRVAVSRPSPQQALWLPFTPIPVNRSWGEAGLAGLLIILSAANMDTFIALKDHRPFQEPQLIEVFDIQLPQTLAIITRLTWYVKLDCAPTKQFRCCQDTEGLVWVEESQLDQGVIEYMWGPELIQFYRCVKDQPAVDCSFGEYNLEMAFQFMPRNPPRTDEEAMLCSSNLSEKDIERLYSDFLDHCFPSMGMAFHSFKVYMTKYIVNFSDNRLMHLFLAFNYSSNGYITFPELLMGLACIDVHSVHNEARAKFVMRYYDVAKRGYLTREDLRQMISDMNPSASAHEVEERLKDTLEHMDSDLEPGSKNKISYRVFLSAIGTHRFRGTSKLCRSSGPIFLMISNVIFSRMKKRDSKHSLQVANVIEPTYMGVCLGCKEKRASLHDHMARLNRDGFVKERVRIAGPRDGKKAPASTRNIFQLHSQMRCAVLGSSEEDLANVAWIAIQMVHEFVGRKGDTRHPNGMLGANFRERELFYQVMCSLEKKLLPLLEKESRCVSVSSPAYVIGDIHGNIEDLLSLEKCIWRRFPSVGANLVFLGDYVDRGKWSIECATYLCALKVLMPGQVSLLRGNHEVRALQCHYSYRVECLAKYGDEFGPKVWEITNRIFDRLPLCAVIDDVIFCAHGGIPRSTQEVHDIQKLASVICNPEHESRLAWEILWSDPIHQQQFLEMSCLLKDDSNQKEGFLFNKKRGTAFVFNEDAASRFLDSNGLTHIIRAHEVPTNGFFFHFDKKCATIFSCSHYCGNCNECAVVLVNRDLIRIIRVDTANNVSATD